MPRRMPRVAAVLLAMVVAGAVSLRAEEPDHYVHRDPYDVTAEGDPRPLGTRIPVVFVHGLMQDDLVLEDKIHVVFSVLRGRFEAAVARELDPFETVMPVYYRYRPDRPYRELGEQFAARMNERFPGRTLILVVHSAGALVARWAGPSLDIAAVVGMAPAHGGSPGASMIFASHKIVEDGKVAEEHFQTYAETRSAMAKLSEPVLRSVAWDGVDGAISDSDVTDYGVARQEKLPDFRYARLDHYGILEHFVPAFGALDFVAEKGRGGKDQRQREWESLGAWSGAWKASDGVVVPYPEGPWDGDFPSLRIDHKGIGHREIFMDKDVLSSVWRQVLDLARQLREM